MAHLVYILGFLLANFLTSHQSGILKSYSDKRRDRGESTRDSASIMPSGKNAQRTIIPSQTWYLEPAVNSNKNRAKGKSNSFNQNYIKRHNSIQRNILSIVEESVFSDKYSATSSRLKKTFYSAPKPFP